MSRWQLLFLQLFAALFDFIERKSKPIKRFGLSGRLICSVSYKLMPEDLKPFKNWFCNQPLIVSNTC